MTFLYDMLFVGVLCTSSIVAFLCLFHSKIQKRYGLSSTESRPARPSVFDITELIIRPLPSHAWWPDRKEELPEEKNDKCEPVDSVSTNPRRPTMLYMAHDDIINCMSTNQTTVSVPQPLFPPCEVN